ncbi:hypothetical protein ACOME3_010228 [Neoechinorhynchus agilis]
MSTVKDILAQAIQCQKIQRGKANGLKRQTKVSKVNSKKQTKGLLKSDSEAFTKENTANVSTITWDLVPSSEAIRPVVLYDSNITVEESDIVTGIKGDPAEVTTKKATVEQ